MHEKIYTRFDRCELSWVKKGGLFPFSLVRLCSGGQWNWEIEVEVH